MTDRISERDLILPALWCISRTENGFISTTELMQCLREVLRPTGEDLSILAGRNDDKFSQKVRNLRSHKTLESFGFATYDQRGRNGYWAITPHGQKYLADNLPFLRYILTHDFDYEDTKRVLEEIEVPDKKKGKKRQKIALFDENVVISEGMKVNVEQHVYVRSDKLRKVAIEHYSQGGAIVCKACSFDFESVYGELGKGFIEIHHVKPVYAYEDTDLNIVISEALENVVPLCSNCHRMIHRRLKQPLLVSELS